MAACTGAVRDRPWPLDCQGNWRLGLCKSLTTQICVKDFLKPHRRPLHGRGMMGKMDRATIANHSCGLLSSQAPCLASAGGCCRASRGKAGIADPFLNALHGKGASRRVSYPPLLPELVTLSATHHCPAKDILTDCFHRYFLVSVVVDAGVHQDLKGQRD